MRLVWTSKLYQFQIRTRISLNLFVVGQFENFKLAHYRLEECVLCLRLIVGVKS